MSGRLLSQELSEFALHVRAILGFPIPAIVSTRPGASVAILGTGDGSDIRYGGVAAALVEEGTELRIFGKPEIHGKRRMAVALACAESVDAAREKARRVAGQVKIEISLRARQPDAACGNLKESRQYENAAHHATGP